MPMSNYELTAFKGLVLQRATAVGEGTLLELTNAYCDLEGIIRSRSGAARINSSQLSDGLGGTNVHSHILWGDFRYTAVSTVLKRGYLLADPNIITGLNGKRISFVHMSPSVVASGKKHTYFANGEAACRKKDDGTTTSNWGIDGPVASEIAAITPTVSAASQPATTAIDTFASAYTVQDGFGTDAAATSPYATSARSFTVPATKNERFRRTGLTLNLSGSGEDAFIRIMLRVDNRQNLDHAEVALSSDAGVFTTDFYTYRIAALDFTEDNSWQEFKIPKNVFERVKPTGGSADTWANIDGVQITVGANSKGAVVVSADDARMEADTHPDGTYDYKVTIWNDTLKIRSNPRRLADIYTEAPYVTAQVTVHRQRVTLARPAGFASWDPQGTHWEVWRRNILVGDGKWHFHSRATVATATINDDLNELAVGEALLEINHIPPPSKFILGPYDNRCFFFGMSNVTSGSTEEEAPNTFRWSEAGYPESVPFTNYNTAGDPTDTIQGGCMWAGNIYLWTKARVYEVSGRQGSYVAIPTEAPVGTTSPYSIAASVYGIFYRGLDGIYLLSQGTAQNISLEIALIFHSGSVVLDGLTIYAMDAITTAKSENVVGTFFEDRYIFAYTDVNGTRTTLWYHVPTKRWHRAQNTTANSGWNVQSLGWMKVSGATDQADNLEGGSSDGWLMNFDSYVNNPGLFVDGGGAAIPFAVQLKAWDAELKPTDVETDLKDLVLDVDTGGQTLTVQASFDGAAYTSIGTVSTAARDKVYLPISGGVGTIAFRCAVRITGSLSTARVTLWSVGTQHIPEPKRLLDSSTDYDQQGWPAEKILQELQIEANTFGSNVVVTVEADGANLAQTFTLNTSVRRMQTFSFTVENPRATNLRLKWNGSVESKIYGYQFQFLKEPLAVTILETEVTDEGWPAEKILQELQITANTHGVNVTVTVEADGANLAQTFTLNTATHRDQVFSFTVENPRATNLRLKMVGSAEWTYYKHQFQFLKEPLSCIILETESTNHGWPSEKILQELSIVANTHGSNVTVTIEADGSNLAQTVTLNTAAHQAQVFSLNIENPRATFLRLKMVGSIAWSYYGHDFQFLKEPLSVVKLETEVTEEGWPGEKILQELQITANTHGVNVTVVVETDGVDLPQIFTLNTAFHRDQVFSFNIENPRATNLRLKMTGTQAWIYYKHQFQFLKEPLSITKLQTEITDEGWPGEKILQELQVTANTHGNDVSIGVQLDGVHYTTLILNTEAHRDQVFSFNVSHPRATNIRLEFTGTSVWLYYKHRFQYLQEPISVTKIEDKVQLDGWSGPKMYLEGNLEVNTKGQDVRVHILVDNVVRQAKTINTTAHTTATIEMTTSPEGRASAVSLTSIPNAVTGASHSFLYYGWTWTRVMKLPDEVTVWDSTPIALFGGKRGWLGPRAMFIIKGLEAITATIFMDNVVKATLTVPAQATRSGALVILPIGVTGRVARIIMNSVAPFQLWEDSFIEGHALDGDRAATQWRFVHAEAA